MSTARDWHFTGTFYDHYEAYLSPVTGTEFYHGRIVGPGLNFTHSGTERGKWMMNELRAVVEKHLQVWVPGKVLVLSDEYSTIPDNGVGWGWGWGEGSGSGRGYGVGWGRGSGEGWGLGSGSGGGSGCGSGE